MQIEIEQLARFQGALLELFSEPAMDAERARERLAEDQAFAPFRDYVTAFEPRMLETAIALTRRWGRRGTTGS